MVLAIATAVLTVVAVAAVAYHHGRRHGRVTLPRDLVAELREHKLSCIGEPAPRVALEISLLCDTPPTEAANGSRHHRGLG